MIGADEFQMVPAAYHTKYHVLKFADIRFFECPGSLVTTRSWQIIAFVNETTDAEGNILHLPFPGVLIEQPLWYRTAVKMVRAERHSDWNRDLQSERAKAKADKEKR